MRAVVIDRYLFGRAAMVGAAGFEPATLCSQSRCATRLRYAPPKASAPVRYHVGSPIGKGKPGGTRRLRSRRRSTTMPDRRQWASVMANDLTNDRAKPTRRTVTALLAAAAGAPFAT